MKISKYQKIGMRFGKLTVISAITPHHPYEKIKFECLCDCGNKIAVSGSNLVNKTRSCGCLRGTHGMSHTKTHMAWANMRSRCSQKRFKDYHGRGITVCARWRKFENFLKDMGEKPDGMTLDRINNDAGYFKENCRWATRAQQQNNRRVTRFLTLENTTLSAVDWSKKLSINLGTIHTRIRLGWTEKDILTKPIDIKFSTRKEASL